MVKPLSDLPEWADPNFWCKCSEPVLKIPVSLIDYIRCKTCGKAIPSANMDRVKYT